MSCHVDTIPWLKKTALIGCDVSVTAKANHFVDFLSQILLTSSSTYSVGFQFHLYTSFETGMIPKPSINSSDNVLRHCINLVVKGVCLFANVVVTDSTSGSKVALKYINKTDNKAAWLWL